MQREISILEKVRGVVGVSHMRDYCNEPSMNTWMIVYNKSGLGTLRLKTGTLKQREVKFILYQLLSVIGLLTAESESFARARSIPS